VIEARVLPDGRLELNKQGYQLLLDPDQAAEVQEIIDTYLLDEALDS